jgi:hypothetical protein
MYIHELQQDVQFYKKTAQAQQVQLIEQNKTIKDLEDLTAVMFQYMNGTNYNGPESDSPIHRRKSL